jgi:two-component system, NarL family, sensor kinase
MGEPQRERGQGEPSVRAAVARFAIAGLVAVALVGLAAFLLMRSIGTDEATENAGEVTRLLGEGVSQPNLTRGVLDGEPAALRRFDRTMQETVLTAPIVRIKLWDEDGRIVYSDEPRLIGQKFELGDDELNTLRTGAADADVSDLDEPENQFERDRGKLLEAYARITGPDRRPLLFETYQQYSSVTSSGRSLWLAFLPALIAALIVLELIQLPLASSLARRVRNAHRDRVSLLERAVDSSERERRRIAGDLHDGAVQDMTGVALSLENAARRLATTDPEAAAQLRSGAARTRGSVRSLRGLLHEIYPPSLQRAGLAAALGDMLAPLEARGFETELRFEPGRGLSVEEEALCFRVAQEATRNALKHSGAGRIEVAVVPAEHGGGAIELMIIDDGRGFDASEGVPERAGGHIGTDVLSDLAAESGAQLAFESSPGRGATVRLSLPAS